jgi:hypothetical protein
MTTRNSLVSGPQGDEWKVLKCDQPSASDNDGNNNETNKEL